MNQERYSLPTNQPAVVRAKQLKASIRKLKKEIQKILATGVVAPPGCHVIRYQVRRNQKIYWYYKLQAAEPIFPTAKNSDKKSKYLYLGKAGSSAHLDAVEQVTRRGLIEELQRVLNALSESYLDVCFGGEMKSDPDYYPEGIKQDI